MGMKKNSVVITAYEYNVLNQNSLIAFTCARQLNSAIKQDDEVELLMTESELSYLIGYVAAEANHARSNKKRSDLNQLCDFLEAAEQGFKHLEPHK